MHFWALNFLSRLQRLQFSTAINFQVGCKHSNVMMCRVISSIKPGSSQHLKASLTPRVVYSYGLDLLKIEISVRYICVWHRLKQSSVRIAEVLSESKADIVHSPRTSAKTAQVQSLKQVLPIDPERTKTQILIFKNPIFNFKLETSQTLNSDTSGGLVMPSNGKLQ